MMLSQKVFPPLELCRKLNGTVVVALVSTGAAPALMGHISYCPGVVTIPEKVGFETFASVFKVVCRSVTCEMGKLAVLLNLASSRVSVSVLVYLAFKLLTTLLPKFMSSLRAAASSFSVSSCEGAPSMRVLILLDTTV